MWWEHTHKHTLVDQERHNILTNISHFFSPTISKAYTDTNHELFLNLIFGSKTGREKSDDDDQRVAQTGMKERTCAVVTSKTKRGLNKMFLFKHVLAGMDRL